MNPKEQKAGAIAKRTPEEILKANDAELTTDELTFKAQYLAEQDAQDADVTSAVPRPLRLEVASSQQLFKLPNGASSSKLTMVVLASLPTRGLWHKENKDDRGILCCTSIGGKVGNPTDEGIAQFEFLRGSNPVCAHCLANVWRSAGDGSKGKKCKEMRALLVFHPSCRSALKLSVPPSSIVAYDDYFATAKGAGRPIAAHWTEIELLPAGKKPEIYSLFRFTMKEILSPEELSSVRELRTQFKEALGIVEDDDYRTKPLGTEVERQEPPDPQPEKGWKGPAPKDEDIPF